MNMRHKIQTVDLEKKKKFDKPQITEKDSRKASK